MQLSTNTLRIDVPATSASVAVSNGTGVLVPGPATFRLRFYLNGTTILDEESIPVTLTVP